MAGEGSDSIETKEAHAERVAKEAEQERLNKEEQERRATQQQQWDARAAYYRQQYAWFVTEGWVNLNDQDPLSRKEFNERLDKDNAAARKKYPAGEGGLEDAEKEQEEALIKERRIDLKNGTYVHPNYQGSINCQKDGDGNITLTSSTPAFGFSREQTIAKVDLLAQSGADTVYLKLAPLTEGDKWGAQHKRYLQKVEGWMDVLEERSLRIDLSDPNTRAFLSALQHHDNKKYEELQARKARMDVKATFREAAIDIKQLESKDETPKTIAEADKERNAVVDKVKADEIVSKKDSDSVNDDDYKAALSTEIDNASKAADSLLQELQKDKNRTEKVQESYQTRKDLLISAVNTSPDSFAGIKQGTIDHLWDQTLNDPKMQEQALNEQKKRGGKDFPDPNKAPREGVFKRFKNAVKSIPDRIKTVAAGSKTPTKLDTMDNLAKQTNEQVTKHEERIQKLEEKLTKMEEKQEELANKVRELKDGQRAEDPAITEKITKLEEKMKTLDDGMKEQKGLIDKAKRTREEIKDPLQAMKDETKLVRDEQERRNKGPFKGKHS